MTYDVVMKPRAAAQIGIGVSVLIVILTVVLDIFPYFVIGIITLLLAVLVLIDGIREYRRPPSTPEPQSPANWTHLAGC